MKSSKKTKVEAAPSFEDFDLAQTWNDIPIPVKYGVPSVLLLAVFWVNFGNFSSGPEHIGQAENLIYALVSNNRSKVVSLSTADSADAAGKWFDVLHPEVEKSQIGTDVNITPALFSGNPEKDSDITLLVVLSNPSSDVQPVTITLPMKRNGGNWMFNGNQGLDSANQAAAAAAKSSSASAKK